MSTAALPVSFPDAAASNATRKPLVTSRTLKITAAASIALAGGYGLLSESQYIASSNAVVSSYVLEVKTPITGTLEGMRHSAGEAVREGEVLARIESPLTDHQHLDNLRISAQTAESTRAGLEVERHSLQALQAGLLAREGQHRAAMGERLVEQQAEATHTLAAREIALAQATAERVRGGKLAALGVIPAMQLELLTSTEASLREEVAALRASLAQTQSQLNANARGVLSERGTNNDVAYSRQRADEVAIRLAENARSLIAAGDQATQAQTAADAEEHRVALLSQSVVRAPSAGILWRLYALNGENAASGSPIFSLVDCNQQFVLAAIPQDRLPDLAASGAAMVRLAGESTERSGTVVFSSGDPQHDLDRKLAAAPSNDRSEQLATVMVRLDGDAGTNRHTACSVGRTAQVRIQTTRSNFISRWLRRSM